MFGEGMMVEGLGHEAVGMQIRRVAKIHLGAPTCFGEENYCWDGPCAEEVFIGSIWKYQLVRNNDRPVSSQTVSPVQESSLLCTTGKSRWHTRMRSAPRVV
eukprot:Gb_31438 [translate_table: standard]